jgi:hypothetical protein
MEQILYQTNINVFAITALGYSWIGVFVLAVIGMCTAAACSKLGGEFSFSFRTCNKEDVGSEFKDFIKGYLNIYN